MKYCIVYWQMINNLVPPAQYIMGISEQDYSTMVQIIMEDESIVRASVMKYGFVNWQLVQESAFILKFSIPSSFNL